MAKTKNDKYVESLLGQHVQLVTNLEMSQAETDEGVTMSQTMPLLLTGTLVDYDKMCYYLGNEDGEVTKIVQRTDIVAMQIDPEQISGQEETPIRKDMN